MNDSDLHQSEPTSYPVFPNEIFSRIISRFTTYDRSTLANCCLVSKDICKIARPILWRWLRIHPRIRSHEYETARNFRFLEYSEYLSKLITIITVEPHSYSWCHSHPLNEFNARNLNTVHIRSGGFSSCEKPYHIPDPYIPKKKGVNDCTILRNLRPITLVIRDLGFSDFHLLPNGIEKSFWSKTDTVIFTLPSKQARNGGGIPSYSYTDLPNVKRMFFIYDPTSYMVEDDSAYINQDDGNSTSQDELNFYGLTEISMRFEYCEIIVVNIGSTGLDVPLYKDKTLLKIQQEEEKAIREYYTEDRRLQVDDRDPELTEPKIEEAITKRLKLFRFITLDEFIEEDEWVDWFDLAELEKWKKAMER